MPPSHAIDHAAPSPSPDTAAAGSAVDHAASSPSPAVAVSSSTRVDIGSAPAARVPRAAGIDFFIGRKRPVSGAEPSVQEVSLNKIEKIGLEPT